jgi:hypothetical protein
MIVLNEVIPVVAAKLKLSFNKPTHEPCQGPVL